jgi:Zn-dependent protease
MFGSWRIARILGIDLSIHWTFWLLPVWIMLTWNADEATLMPLWMHLILVGCLFVCVVLHEFGHALTAQRFGIGTRSITLSPLGGIAQLDRMSHEPWEEFCIAIAGPLVNVAIAFVLGIGTVLSFALVPGVTEWLAWRFVFGLTMLNVALVVFNMVPAFPMDGGRVLRAILAGSLGLLQGTRIAVTIGTVLAILMGAAGLLLLGNPWLFLISIFVLFAGQQELRMLELEDRQRNEAMRMTVCLWDSRRGGWVRRDMVEPVEQDSWR